MTRWLLLWITLIEGSVFEVKEVSVWGNKKSLLGRRLLIFA